MQTFNQTNSLVYFTAVNILTEFGELFNKKNYNSWYKFGHSKTRVFRIFVF